ncbi:hypothetical protein SteCoe_23003 [Stentor coeruleus]|uniref:GTP-binding protein n=1 Tax=Stentor coeruleus TaxID=5963 RepID=A0A1R2BKU7_9CILI|nr:hypothetical protein SteCoe_23003 [Stentor coeruleus]
MQIALLGTKKVGKSSILKVVFQKMSPNETLFIDSTSRIEEIKVENNPYTKYTFVDFPGSFEVSQINTQDRKILSKCAMIIYVLDAQDQPYNKPLEKFINIITEVHSFNPDCMFEMFIHKIDGDMFVTEDLKLEAQNGVSFLLKSDIQERKLPEPGYFLTSIYDLSIFEALSKILIKVSPQVNYIQNMLDNLMNYCRIDKVYLFDVINKLYIATDSTPVDLISYELCADMIDVVIDVSCIYGITGNDNMTSAFDRKSTSVIKLDSGLTLYLREIEHMLALVCLVKEDNFDRQNLIDYNIDIFKDGVKQIFQAHEKLLKSEENKT